MTETLTGLAPDTLIELGGLKARCSAGLRCAAHGLDLPCDVCEVEGSVGVVCKACGHHFIQGILQSDGRPCESVAAFQRSGRIAFEEEAIATLHQREVDRRRREEAQRLAEQRERAERERAERERTPTAEEGATEAIDDPPDFPPPNAPETPRPRARFRWASAALVLVIAGIAGQYSRMSEDSQRETPSRGDIGASRNAALETRSEPVPGNAPGQEGPTVPVPEGFVTDDAAVLSEEEFASLRKGLGRIAETGFVVRVVIVKSAGSQGIARLSERIFRAWNNPAAGYRTDLLIVAAVREGQIKLELGDTPNRALARNVAAELASKHDALRIGASDLGTGLTLLVEKMEQAVAASREPMNDSVSVAVATTQAPPESGTTQAEPAAEAPAAVVSALGEIIKAVDGLAKANVFFADGTTSDIARALDQIGNLPKPQRGNRKVARQLLSEGLSLLSREGEADAAVDMLRKAHSADPLDVQIVSDLAYAELVAGHVASAREHVLRTLSLAPTRTVAWATWAEIQALTVPDAKKAVEESVRLFMVGYWFSGDRQQTIKYLEAKTAAQPLGRVGLAAASALERIRGWTGVSSVVTSSDGSPSQRERETAMALLTDAEGALHEFKFDTARTYIASARRLDPTNPRASLVEKRLREQELRYLRDTTTVR